MSLDLNCLKDSLFHDGTKEYRSPLVPDVGEKVLFTLRMPLEYKDKVTILIDGNPFPMTKSKRKSKNNRFAYYTYSHKARKGTIHYYFRINFEGTTYFYDCLGMSTGYNPDFEFKVTTGFHTPDWAKGVVMYQIFVDRFFSGNDDNDVTDGEYFYVGNLVKHAKWDSDIEHVDIGRFYGGDLQGVIKKLDYLSKLGVEALYLNPIFVSPSNHKYDIQDYDHIDPHYGKIVNDGGNPLHYWDNNNSHASKYIKRVTDKENLEASNEVFAELVEEAHKRGIKVIIDGVFNHCGSFNKWMDRELIYRDAEGFEKGAYVSANSPYRDFFKFEEDYDYCSKYEGWWGYDTLPKLNYEGSKELYDYIMRIAEKWVSPPFNADGWRLDVAADLGHSREFNHKFWKDFRKVVKEANPNAIILAEHYGDPTEWVSGGEWDSIMNYDAFMEPVSWFLTGVDKHSDNVKPELKGDGECFIKSMAFNMAKLQSQSILVSMNQLSNHDHSRFLTRTNGKAGRLTKDGKRGAEEGISMAIMKEAIVMQMTWPGAPTLYYGDEAGVCGWTDPDNRRVYPWGSENFDLLEFYRYAIHIHRHNEALRDGALIALIARDNLVCYSRFSENSKVITLINTSLTNMEIDIPVWKVDISDGDTIERILYSHGDKYNMGKVDYIVENGMLHVNISGEGAMIFRAKKIVRPVE